MRKLKPTLAIVSIVAAGIVAAPTLYAQTNQTPSGSTGGQGMMRDGMMGQGGMMGMMQQMTQMMDQCNRMMGARGGNQNEQKPTPSEPEKKG